MVIALKFDEAEVSFDALRYSRVDFSSKLMLYGMVLLIPKLILMDARFKVYILTSYDVSLHSYVIFIII
jgi:hypothetical protein